MELVLNVEDMKTLKEKGLLEQIIDGCSYDAPCKCQAEPKEEPKEEPKAEEKPKKKTTKKKAEPKEEPKEVQDDGFVDVDTKLTHDDLVRAAMPIVKEGKTEELSKLLATYGVDSIPNLAESQIEQFAGDLTAMGAKL